MVFKVLIITRTNASVHHTVETFNSQYEADDAVAIINDWHIDGHRVYAKRLYGPTPASIHR